MAYDNKDTLSAIVGEVIASDPEVRDAYRRLLLDGAKELRLQLKLGSTEERMSLLKAILPHAMKALIKSDAQEEDQQVKDAYSRIMSHVRGDGQ